MGFVGFRHKLSSKNIVEIKKDKGHYYLFGQEVYELEICGVLISEGNRYFTCCDLFGEFSLFKNCELKIPTGSVCFIIRPYDRNGKIEFYCKSAVRITFYQEMVFHLELKALCEQGCYK